MKKINLRGLSEIMKEKELKNVLGGSGGGCCSNLEDPCTVKCSSTGQTYSTPYANCWDLAQNCVGNATCSGWCMDLV